MDERKRSSKDAQRERRGPQTTRQNDTTEDEKAPYKTEPGLKSVTGIIEECHKTAFKFKVEPLGEMRCPVPSEVE